MPDTQWRALADAGAPAAKMLIEQSPDSQLRRLDHERVSEMDAAGVVVSLLSLPPPGVGSGDPRRINDELISAASRYPSRFYVLASLPLPDARAALRELERISDEPLVRGIVLYADGIDYTLDESRFVALYEAIADRAFPIVIHPSLDRSAAGGDDYGLASVLQVMSSSVAGLRLILSGLLDRVPNLTLVIPHLGGVIPYLCGRVDALAQSRAEHDLGHYLRERIFTDSCSRYRPALRLAVEAFGADRIMLGSDYPFRGPPREAIEDVTAAGLARDDERAVLASTARALFALPIDAP